MSLLSTNGKDFNLDGGLISIIFMDYEYFLLSIFFRIRVIYSKLFQFLI